AHRLTVDVLLAQNRPPLLASAILVRAVSDLEWRPGLPEIGACEPGHARQDAALGATSPPLVVLVHAPRVISLCAICARAVAAPRSCEDARSLFVGVLPRPRFGPPRSCRR